MTRFLKAAALTMILASAAGLSTAGSRAVAGADVIPRELGYAGGFSRNGDTFEFDLSSGARLLVDREGEVDSFDAGAATVRRDKAGRPHTASDRGGLLLTFAYSKDGQLIGFRSRLDGSFHLAYSRGKKLVHILFPNHQKAYFPSPGGR